MSHRPAKENRGTTSLEVIDDALLRTVTRKGGDRSLREPIPVPTITFMSGSAVGRELPLLQQRVVFGRGEDSDVIVPDPAVSRRHLQLLSEPARSRRGVKVTLQDLGSTNGTRVNSNRVKQVVLKPGDKILLGRMVLKFEYRDMADQQFYEEMYRRATTDELTGLLNKFAILQFLGEEASKADRYARRLSVLILDLDDFKLLNDTHGHVVADEALQVVAAVLRAGTRQQDRCGRFGGEEFLVVLPETGIRGARVLADRVRAKIAATALAELQLDRPLTASFGVAAFCREARSPRLLLEWADKALYRAKARGKNRVDVWTPSKDTASPD